MTRTRSLAAAILLLGTTFTLTPSPASASFGDAAVQLTPIVTLDEPIAMASRIGDTDLYFAEKAGKVKRFNGLAATEILDIASETSNGGEQGLLGLAFSPSGDALYVNFTDNSGDTVVRRYSFDGTTLTSPVQVIAIDQPFDNHNGGNLAFGPDGHLYIGMGDGGGQNDPGNRAQSKTVLLGKMLRIDPVATGGYTAPDDNPYVGTDGADEIWGRGLRNPWRYSFDGDTGDLWIGDVGGARFEEINRQSVNSDGGENYGWRRMEGRSPNVGRPLPPAKHAEPFAVRKHSNGYCAITGGYVYRGSAIPDLVGAYLYGDFCRNDVRAFPIGAKDQDRDLDIPVNQLVSFGEDNAGELYTISLGGDVSRIDPAV